MFATATTCKIAAVPTARAQRRARRSVAVRAEGAEETAAPVAVRAHRARRARGETEDDVWIARDGWGDGRRAMGWIGGKEFASARGWG